MSKKTLMELTIAAFDVCGVTSKPDTSQSCLQLWNSLDPAEQGRFSKGMSAMSNEIYKLMNKDWIARGDSVYNAQNRAVFTFYKTDRWPADTQAIKTEIDADELPIDDEQLTDTDQSIKDVFNDDSWSGLEPDKFKDFLDNPGFIKDVPDMVKVEFDYDHNGVTIPVQFYFTAEIPATPAPISIARKKEKLAVLQHFKQFVAVVNTDFERVIDDIILDLNQLVEVE